MKKSLPFMLTLTALALTAAGALAAFPAGVDRLGLYTSTSDATAARELTTSTPFQSVTLYLVATGVSRVAGVSGWECRISHVGNPVAASWSLTGGATNFLTAPEFAVGVGTGDLALPNVGGVVHLATVTFFVQMPTDAIYYFLHPMLVSSQTYPVYANGNNEFDLVELGWSNVPAGWADPIGEDWPIFAINGGPVANEEGTWGGVKNIYRD